MGGGRQVRRRRAERPVRGRDLEGAVGLRDVEGAADGDGEGSGRVVGAAQLLVAGVEEVRCGLGARGTGAVGAGGARLTGLGGGLRERLQRDC